MQPGHRTLRDPRSFVASASGIKDAWSRQQQTERRGIGLRDQDAWSRPGILIPEEQSRDEGADRVSKGPVTTRS